METGVFVYYIYRPCWSGRYQFQIPVRTNQTGPCYRLPCPIRTLKTITSGPLRGLKSQFCAQICMLTKINLLPILTYAEPSVCKGTVSGLFQLVIDIGLLVKSCDCNTWTNLCNITYNNVKAVSRLGNAVVSLRLVLHSDLVTSSSSIRWSRVDNFLFAPSRCRCAFFEQKCVLRLRCVTYFHVHIFLRCSRTS